MPASWQLTLQPETPSVVRETIAELRATASDCAFVRLSRIVVLFERAVVCSERTVVWFFGIVFWFSETGVRSIRTIVWSIRTIPWFLPGGVRGVRTSIPGASGDLAAIHGSLMSSVRSYCRVPTNIAHASGVARQRCARREDAAALDYGRGRRRMFPVDSKK
jgi:hypothetical protein